MNHRCIKLANSFFLFFVCSAFAQNNIPYSTEFYTYLKQQHLYTEQITYLNTVQPVCGNVVCADTLFLTKALCFYALNDTNACSRMVDSIKTLSSFSDKNFQENYFSLLFSQKKIWLLKKNILMVDTNLLFNRQSKFFLQIVCREKIATTPCDTMVLNDYPLQGILNRYKHQSHKSPMVAGLLSAVVPGLGKLYAGYKYQALSAFTTNVFFASQAVEAIVKSGFKSGHFIYTCSIFSLYYVGNIVGSVLAVKKKKRDYLNQLDDEIIYYYSSRLGAYTN